MPSNQLSKCNGISGLTAALAADAAAFMEKETRFFFNECDMQVRLCDYLMATGRYSAVIPEYRVPLGELVKRGVPGVWDGRKWVMTQAFPWNNDVFVDIVVESSGEYCCLELKYATASLRDDLNVFDERLLGDKEIIKNQAASNLVMYNYWKDVRRLEVITDKFRKVTGGIALLLTNDSCYWNEPRAGVKYLPFSTHEGRTVCPGMLEWNGKMSAGTLKSHMPFDISGNYVCAWKRGGMNAVSRSGNRFQYLLNIIH